jgi:hypothetical protein
MQYVLHECCAALVVAMSTSGTGSEIWQAAEQDLHACFQGLKASTMAYQAEVHEFPACRVEHGSGRVKSNAC